IKKESALNNFTEYTMLDSAELTTYFGFTESEVESLCQKYEMNMSSVKEWYNGYLINKKHMYNPNSVYQAMSRQSLESYWKNTSAFDTINSYIMLDFDGLKQDITDMLAGKPVYVDVRGFENDLSVINTKDDALTALIHLGYLGYNKEDKTAYIPNYEVKEAYQSALSKGNWKEISKSISRCEELLFATIRGNSDRVAELLELSHDTYTSVLKYNDENALSCAITMAYYTAPAYYNVIRELPTGKGFADIALIPRADSGNKPAMIIELKWDKDADTAIKQIKEKRYSGTLKGYGKEILLVGVNYDKDTKKHECIIESVDNCN
ncbi:MAG: PD-(D/E)XK nuclease domain-containing protein, partial [Oscillospiraceae bacterium]|nr:PD-(D/E)XK nuclease domain-containing protein [Oscillospiraceae bacterium]